MENVSTGEVVYLCVWFEFNQANGTFLFGEGRREEGVVPECWCPASELLHVTR